MCQVVYKLIISAISRGALGGFGHFAGCGRYLTLRAVTSAMWRDASLRIVRFIFPVRAPTRVKTAAFSHDVMIRGDRIRAGHFGIWCEGNEPEYTVVKRKHLLIQPSFIIWEVNKKNGLGNKSQYTGTDREPRNNAENVRIASRFAYVYSHECCFFFF